MNDVLTPANEEDDINEQFLLHDSNQRMIVNSNVRTIQSVILNVSLTQ